jgi:hypothetical protein
MRSVLVGCLLVLTLAAVGCAGPPPVTFDHEQCFLDGEPATLGQVEAMQSRIAQRVLDRQPIYVVVTLAVILLAGASHIEKLLVLLAARPRSEHKGLGERIRVVLDRYRARPLRYFAIVTSTLLLLGIAGGLYIYLDADKRASERALGQLQFCQLALKNADEQSALAEQRKNLDSLRATAGDIKSLVDTLPPEEQRKAALLLNQMHSALGNQDRLLARSNLVAQAVQQRSEEIKKGLGVLSLDVGGLRTLPAQLREIDATVRRLDGRGQLQAAGGPGGRAPATVGEALAEVRRDVAGVGDRVGKVDCAQARLPSGRTVGEALAELLSRPPPVCRCEAASPGRSDGGAR